jgi:protein-S-isoprenylcysteine O-methyltransferase Ste14
MFWLIFTIAIWGLLHSLLASTSFKYLARRAVGDGLMKWYRLLYNLFAVVSLAPALYLMVSLPNQPLYQVPGPWSYLLLAGQVLSAVFLLIAALQTDLLSFAGLRQWIEEEKTANLVTTGLYRFVRHPLYTFSLLLLWLSPSMSINSFVVYAVLTLYVLIGIMFEERKLLREFGQAYADYRSSTPMLLPGLSKTVAKRRAPAENLAGTNDFGGPS